MSELDQIYQDFYEQVRAKILADYEVFQIKKADYQPKAQIKEFQYLLLGISGDFSHSYEDPKIDKTNYLFTQFNHFRKSLVEDFRRETKKNHIYRQNPVSNFLKEEKLIKIATANSYSSSIPSKEILAKTLASYDAYIDIYEQLQTQLEKENSFPIMNVKQTLRQWLANGENERVVEAILRIAEQSDDKYFSNDALQVAGRFNSLQRDYKNGILDAGFYNIQLNNIRQTLQSLIDKVPANATLPDVAMDAPVPIPLGNEGNGTPTQTQTPLAEHSKKQPADTNANIPWIIGLGLLILATLLAAVIPCPGESLSLASRILLSLGAAGIATILPGLFSIDLQGVKAGSAIGVFALVYLVNPAKAIENNNCEPQFTSVTVFVHGKNGRQDMILRQQGFVLLDVSNERKRASINENGQAFFQNLRIGDTMQLNVDFSEPYKATQPDKKYVIEDEGSIYLEAALQGLDKVFGTVLDNDNPLKDVIVSIGTLRDTTDETGYYEIRIPENLQQKQQAVKFTKPGFKMMTKTAYPQTNASLNIIMEK